MKSSAREGGVLGRVDPERRIGTGELVDGAQRLHEVNELLGADMFLQPGAVLVGDAAGLESKLLGELQGGTFALGEERRSRVVGELADLLLGEPCFGSPLVPQRAIEVAFDQLRDTDPSEFDEDRIGSPDRLKIVIQEQLEVFLAMTPDLVEIGRALTAIHNTTHRTHPQCAQTMVRC